jgi:translation initiation factor 1 (eIF-1/SUI1)
MQMLRKLDEGGVAIMNYLKGYGDENAEAYNKNVFKPYLRNKRVDTSGGGFVRPEFISTDFITAQNVADLLKKRFQTNATVKKSDIDLKDMIQVGTNVINKVANPSQTLKTLGKSPANNKIITEFANITNSLNDDQINDIKMENDTTEYKLE